AIPGSETVVSTVVSALDTNARIVSSPFGASRSIVDLHLDKAAKQLGRCLSQARSGCGSGSSPWKLRPQSRRNGSSRSLAISQEAAQAVVECACALAWPGGASDRSRQPDQPQGVAAGSGECPERESSTG